MRLQLQPFYLDTKNTQIYYYEFFIDEFSIENLVAFVQLNPGISNPWKDYYASPLFDIAGKIFAQM